MGWIVTLMRGQVSLLVMGTPPTIELANLGMADSLILMVMALVVFGPRRLPQIGRQIGKLMYEFRKASNDFKFQMEEELRNAEDADRRKKEEERLQALALTTPAKQETTAAAPTLEAALPAPAEELYPPVYNAIEPAAEETVPRILPPSIGEQVAAAKPNRTTLAQAAEHARALNSKPVEKELSAGEDTESAPEGGQSSELRAGADAEAAVEASAAAEKSPAEEPAPHHG